MSLQPVLATYPCGTLQIDNFEFCFSIRLSVPAEFATAAVEFSPISIGPIFTAYGIPFPLVIYPNYYQVKLKNLSEPEYFFKFIQFLSPVNTVFCCNRLDRSLGTIEALFENKINIRSVKASIAENYIYFEVLNSITELDQKLEGSSITDALINEEGLPGLVKGKKLIRAFVNMLLPCNSIEFVTQFRITSFNEATSSFVDVDTLDCYFALYCLVNQSSPATFPTNFRDVLYAYLLSHSSVILISSLSKISFVPCFYDGSPVYEIPTVFILDYDIINLNTITPYYFGVHYSWSLQRPDLYQNWYTSEYWRFFSSQDFETQVTSSSVLLSNLYFCLFPCDSRFDQQYQNYNGTTFWSPVDLQLIWDRLVCDTVRSRDASGNFSNQYAISHPAGENAASFYSFFNYNLQQTFLLNCFGIRLRLKGLSYPLDKFFKFENRSDFPFNSITFRCRRYTMDLAKNEIVLDLYPG